MSTVTELLATAQDGRLLDNLADRFGLSRDQIAAAVDALTPALEAGLGKAAQDPAALEKLIGAVTHPTHQAAFDDAETAHSDDSVAQGREVVSHLFGSSAAAGQVAQIAARDAGLRPDLLAQLLPVLASVVFGGLFKSFAGQGLGGVLASLAGSGALNSILGALLSGGLAAPTQGAPSSAGGGFGGLLGGLLGALLGGGRASAPSNAAPAGPALPAGLDPADLQSAFNQIKKTLQPGAPASSSAQADLEDVLGKVFGPAR